MSNKVLFIVVPITIFSCSKIDCEKFAKEFQLKECNIVVNNTPDPGRRFKIEGINPVTKSGETYLDQDAWYLHFNHKIELGDTIVKKLGETRLNIHKKDTVLVYQYSCGGKIF
jgi:hypothetical protein